MNPQNTRVWLITGSSSGFGRSLAEAVLNQGDRLIATARKPEQLTDLVRRYPERVKAIALDVTQPDRIPSAIAQGVDAFGRIDVLVNNAGYGLIGALEEVSPAQIRRNFDTNLFGAIDVIRAILPIMRQQGSGHIINMSAIAGFTNELGFSIYGGAKFALEGVSEALRGEVAPFGIHVTIVEPGPFRTDFIGRSLDRVENPMPEYEPTVGKFLNFLNNIEAPAIVADHFDKKEESPSDASSTGAAQGDDMDVDAHSTSSKTDSHSSPMDSHDGDNKYGEAENNFVGTTVYGDRFYDNHDNPNIEFPSQ